MRLRTDAPAPVAVTVADVPAPESAPTVSPVDVLLMTPALNTDCPTVPMVAPPNEVASMAAFETEAIEPVALIDADAPLPRSARLGARSFRSW